MKRILISALLLVFSLDARAYDTRQLLDSRLDPALALQTIETEHFRIHFDPALLDSAQYLARIAEPVEKAISGKLGWHCRTKTDLVLVATNDRTDVFTITYPTTQIFMNDSPPYLSQGIDHYGDWLRWLLVHEYTHVVHVDRVSGLSRLLRPVLGTFDRPNMLQPAWLREGLAVTNETELDTSGRADSTSYRMMLRSADRAGLLGSPAFGSIGSAAFLTGERWPWVLRSYLWGSVLAETLDAQRPDAAAALIDAGARGVPGLMGSALARARLLSPHALDERAVAWVHARAQAEMEILEREPETPVVALTTDGYNKFGPAIAPDGSEIAFTRERPQDDNMTILLSLDAKGDVSDRRDLFPRGIGYQLSYSRSGRYIAYDTLAHHGRYDTFSDLFLFDRDTDHAVLRSRGLRARDADIHPDGRTLAFVQRLDDRQAIVASDSGFGDRRVLYRPNTVTRLAEPHWSPDGEQLVFVEHDSGGGERLRLWDAGGVRALTDGTSQDRDPSFTPDGRFVLFSSDRGGLFQIYALEIASGAVKQVTHRYGGAFWPVADPLGRFLFFLDYSERGYDLVRTDWNPDDWWTPDARLWLPVTGSRDARGPALRAPQPVAATGEPPPPAQAYAAGRYLSPAYLQPSFALRRAGTQWGVSTGGIDPAYRHHYQIAARWDTGFHEMVGRAYYFNGAHRFPFTFESTRDVSAVEVGGAALDLADANAELYVPISDQRRRYLRIGIDAQRYEQGDSVQRLMGVKLAVEYDSTLRQPNDFTAERGVSYEIESRPLLRAGDRPVLLAEARIEKPLALPFLGPHSVVTLSGQAAVARSWGRHEYVLYAGGRESFPFSLTSAFDIAGYAPNRLAADRVAIGRAHFTKPVAVVQRSLSSLPLFLDRFAIGLRAEGAYVEHAGVGAVPWSLGVEALADIQVSHLWPLRVTAGLYRGRRSNGGGTRFVVAVGSD